MKIRKPLVIFLTLLVHCLAKDDFSKYPLCATEGCQCTTGLASSTEVVDITCNTLKDIDIFNASLWSDTTTNQSYPYNSVTLLGNKLTDLSKIIPASNLSYLNLANNDISGIGDSVFQNLQNMRVLILSHNDLEIIHPDAFKGLPQETKLQTLKNLKELRLDHNKLHTLNQQIFEHTTEIEILDLSFNPIGTIDQNTLSAITALSLLKELYLQYTEIKTLPDGMLHTPLHLQTLDLSGNPIMKLPETLGQTHTLTNLYLNNTEIVNLTESNGFPKIPTLKVLHMCNNEFLAHLGKRSLSGLSNLEDLRICNNIVLTEIDSLVIAYAINENGANVWPNIKKLYLQNNKLSYMDSDILANWDSLSELNINDNPWMCECENQWLIEDLMPIYVRINPNDSKTIMCAAPIEMTKFSFYDLYTRKSHMRCLDANGAHPENDAVMLVGILAGILITIPLTLFLILGYRRRWYNICGICDKSAAAYSRRFYTASPTDDFYRY